MRMSPFIVKIGNVHFIAADGNVLLEVPTNNEQDAPSINALSCLLSTYYVFNVRYCPQTNPTYLFLQSEVLNRNDTECQDHKSLKIFLGIYRDEVKSLYK
jgi:hypothetical protein